MDRPPGVVQEGEDEENGEADEHAASGGGTGCGVGVYGSVGVSACGRLCRRRCDVERFVTDAKGFRWDWSKALTPPTVPVAAVVMLPVSMHKPSLLQVHFRSDLIYR